ncbi:type IV pilus modification protein PilV [Halochromatium roseum]|uniref:type IV pilus modification protein PilV n=1 Tax=Halochromatium roseum TaxID=391920 RepID=UPI0019118658|nr:type IV pilus modification protein PilV [Halochromatium roseum]MBK5940601.1 type IV pilus modification protein PilV [Halochromatium roseum]
MKQSKPAVLSRTASHCSSQRGFSIVEVLVSATILSIGLLGLAGLQATSLGFNTSALHRSKATYLAYDIADRMRANRAAALGGAYDGQALAESPPACAEATPTGTLAQRDLLAWTTSLACQLPQGTGAIERTDAIVTVTVQWDDSRGQEPPQQFLMEAEL